MGRGIFEGWHLIILALIIIVLFGWKRLPDAARSLGRSARVFRSEVEEMKKENAAGTTEASSETVAGESITQGRSVDNVVPPDPDGNAVHENAPHTDNQPGQPS